jgi:hypothetical protein
MMPYYKDEPYGTVKKILSYREFFYSSTRKLNIFLWPGKGSRPSNTTDVYQPGRGEKANEAMSSGIFAISLPEEHALDSMSR